MNIALRLRPFNSNQLKQSINGRRVEHFHLRGLLMTAIGRFSREGFAQRKSQLERRNDTIRLELDDGSPLTMPKDAQISWPDGAPVKCIVRDLSHTTAKIEVRSPVPDVFDLVFGDQSRRSCMVVWRKETKLGVKFR
jgi:hypothetical protein